MTRELTARILRSPILLKLIKSMLYDVAVVQKANEIRWLGVAWTNLAAVRLCRCRTLRFDSKSKAEIFVWKLVCRPCSPVRRDRVPIRRLFAVWWQGPAFF
jgi:hypothetical protein